MKPDLIERRDEIAWIVRECVRVDYKGRLDPSTPGEIADKIQALYAQEIERLREALGVEKECASVLLEAAWEALSELGAEDSVSADLLIPAILKADGDPEYARQTIGEMLAGLSALQPILPSGGEKGDE